MSDPKEMTSAKFTLVCEFAQAIVDLSPVKHFTDQYKFYSENSMFDLVHKISAA